MTFFFAGAASQAGEVEHALGDDLALIGLGKSDQFARHRDVNQALENGSVPSAQDYGLASLEPCRIGPVDGQCRDVVQRGLNRP